jgi:CheY-like chemotaxis protein
LKRCIVSFRLLLADDSITIQKVVELILAEEDCEIISTHNGKEALAVLTSFNPDIVLADTEMPAMNGYELCEQIKQEPSTSTIPVILLTGAFEPLDEERARQVKADDYLIKPFEAQELINKINSALAAKAIPVDTGTIPGGEPLSFSEEPGEEDLWTAEEAPETAAVSAVTEEDEAGASTEELIGIAEENEAGEGILKEPAIEIMLPVEKKPDLPVVELLSKDEIQALYEKAIQEKISSLLSSADLKETLIVSMTPFMKDSVDKILWDITPDLIERMLKEILKGSIESLTTEVEKVIWETVPELAETMISQEIERIRSAF